MKTNNSARRCAARAKMRIGIAYNKLADMLAPLSYDSDADREMLNILEYAATRLELLIRAIEDHEV